MGASEIFVFDANKNRNKSIKVSSPVKIY